MTFIPHNNKDKSHSHEHILSFKGASGKEGGDFNLSLILESVPVFEYPTLVLDYL